MTTTMPKESVILHKGFREYHCQLQSANEQLLGKTMWIIDMMYIDPDREDGGIGYVCSADSEAECLRNVPKIIQQLCEFGLSVQESCDLVLRAIGGVPA